MTEPASATFPLVARLLLVILALACAAWLGVSLRNERLQVDGIKALAQKPPDTAAAFEDFRRASQLSASQQPELFEASVYFVEGERTKAIVLLRGLLESEPDNRTGWVLLGNWLEASGEPGAEAAYARARRLNGAPLSP